MNAIQLNEAYAEWVSTNHYDIKCDLNTECELTYEQMSKLLCKFFYLLECHVFGYELRYKYNRDKFRIKRVCHIEGDEKRTHVHIVVKTLDGWTNEQMIELLKLGWKEVNSTQKDKTFIFWAEEIRDISEVCGYYTKETEKQNRKLNDVICLRSSFISKHSKGD